MPEYISEIRQQIYNILAGNDGALIAKAIQQLLKLDSIMRKVNLNCPLG